MRHLLTPCFAVLGALLLSACASGSLSISKPDPISYTTGNQPAPFDREPSDEEGDLYLWTMSEIDGGDVAYDLILEHEGAETVLQRGATLEQIPDDRHHDQEEFMHAILVRGSPGEYTVRVSAEDGRSAEKTVSVQAAMRATWVISVRADEIRIFQFA